MRILQVNDLKTGGGAELVFQENKRLLIEQGFEVENFYLKDSTKYTARDILQYPFRLDFRKNLETRLSSFQPQIVYLHNFYHFLSPSLLYFLQKLKKKHHFLLCMTVHDYHFICANNGCIRKKQGKLIPCHDCSDKRYGRILYRQCDSRGFAYNLLKYMQHSFSYSYLNLERTLDVFLFPSQFICEKYESIRSPQQKAHIIYNPAFHLEKNLKSIHEGAKKISKKDIFESIFIGRLDPVKGIHRFLEEDYSPSKHGRFGIIGDGDQEVESQIRQMIRKKNWEQEVFLLGRKAHMECLSYLSLAQRLIFPSLCYENCPLSVIEALMLNKDIFHYGNGAVPEIISQDLGVFSENYYAQKLSSILKEEYASFTQAMHAKKSLT